MNSLLQNYGLISLKGRDFLTLRAFSPQEVEGLLRFAAHLKAEFKQGKVFRPLQGMTAALIFRKPSTRTRVSFEVAMNQLGGHALNMGMADSQISRGEPIADTARVMSRYVNALVIRTFAHSEIEAYAEAADIPVINALTDLYHPCQALADLLTVVERFGSARGRRLVYIGDGNNVAHSLLFAGAKSGMHVTICAPKGYQPDPEVFAAATEAATETGARLELSESPLAAASGADVLYTDVWTSMGQEAEQAARMAAFEGYQINQAVLAKAAPHAVVLHCLPAHRGEEITNDVIEGPQSAVWDQAENRLHVQKALLCALLA